MGAGSNANDELSTDEIKSELHRLRTELEQLRAENKRLTEENAMLGARLASKSGPGGGGSSGAGESEHERLRKKAEAQRAAKRRRAGARDAAKSRARRRGKRSPREAFVADETIVREVPPSELPADAKANGLVDRHFYGVRIVRHHVLVRLREYISPTQGRIIAKVPEGWSGEFTPDAHITINTLNIGGMTEPKIKELFADHGVGISAGQINHVLLATVDMLREEKVAAHRTGIENSPVVGIDGTHSTCDGEPMVCHIVGNEAFTSMTSTEHKDRVKVIGVLAGEPVGHCVGDHALAHPDLGVAAREVLRRVSNGEPARQGADAELVELSNELRTKGLDAVKMDGSSSKRCQLPGSMRRCERTTSGQPHADAQGTVADALAPSACARREQRAGTCGKGTRAQTRHQFWVWATLRERSACVGHDAVGRGNPSQTAGQPSGVHRRPHHEATPL